MAGKKKARMGRPPLPIGSAREVVFTLRISDAEREVIAAAAERAGKVPAQWAREMLLACARGSDI